MLRDSIRDMPSTQTTTLSITQPDDWHVHFRQAELLRWALPHTTRVFARAVAMPNVHPPLDSMAACEKYHKVLCSNTSKHFHPLVAFHLSDHTSAGDIYALRQQKDGSEANFIAGAKLYPRGATTNSEHGVSDIRHIQSALSALQECGLPLLVHGEDPNPETDVYDREKIYIGEVLEPLRRTFPGLKIVLEHITTNDAVTWVRNHPLNAATITPHHLLLNRSDLFDGGLRPHRYCLPLAKREEHRLGLVAAACSGDACFFAGTDSAPHYVRDKESDCGCAGIFNAPAALETYTEVFEQAESLDKLEAFMSFNGAHFYGREQNRKTITLRRMPWQVPKVLQAGENACVPFRAGETLSWRVQPLDS